ncbi:hypothetical protein UFOVP1264_75 [uncultured Caudovirales phage]|uniref:Uncharacterized protein n=1 Tax=uncultured Caudovirales phage TaxID=2100421 RepID=A0A6J5RAP8_9CAUD|nr:hypothetical protein UFOVP1264_75 [uncultured Caudovirales phage]
MTLDPLTIKATLRHPFNRTARIIMIIEEVFGPVQIIGEKVSR